MSEENITLDQLVQKLDTDRRLSTEVLRNLPRLLTDDDDVPFDLNGTDLPVNVPSIPKLQRALDIAGLSQIGTRLSSQESLTRGAIQEIGRLAAASDLSRQTAYWSPLDLSSENSDAKNNDPLYRANVDDGIRFPYDGYIVNQADRRADSDGQRVGPYLMPDHTETTDKRWTKLTGYLDVAAYPAFTKTINRTVWRYYRYYYGYYWYWRYYYRYYRSAYTYTYTIPGTPVSGSMTAQTFQVDTPKVLKGFELKTYAPGTYKGAANPRVLLVETAYGAPVLDKVICNGSFRNDSNLSSTSSSSAGVSVQVDLEHPVLLEANKSYAFIIVADSAWRTYYSANNDNTGGAFYTQDGQFWSSNLEKDLAYSLRLADFGSQAEHVIELQPLSLSGGIASILLKVAAEVSSESELSFEVSINNQWQHIGIISELESLPPYTPVRVIFKGNSDVMPMLNVEQSRITAFRPATNINYISKMRENDGTGRINVTYEVTGFNDTYHTFDPRLKTTLGEILPTTLTRRESSDGFVSTFDVVFDFPDGINAYQHIVKGGTQTASRLFDVTGIIELS